MFAVMIFLTEAFIFLRKTGVHFPDTESFTVRLSYLRCVSFCAGNGNEGQGSPPSYSARRRESSTVRDRNSSSFSGVFEFPEAL